MAFLGSAGEVLGRPLTFSHLIAACQTGNVIWLKAWAKGLAMAKYGCRVTEAQAAIHFPSLQLGLLARLLLWCYQFFAVYGFAGNALLFLHRQ